MFSIIDLNVTALWSVVLVNLLLTLVLLRRYSQLHKWLSGFDDLDFGLEKGQQAPDFQAETLSGDAVTLADYACKAVSFIFISPHCEPCTAMMPTLSTLIPKAAEAGVEVVLVSTEGGKDEVATIVQKHGLPLLVLYAPRMHNSFADDYKASITPSYYVLDTESCVVATGLFDVQWEEQITRAWSAV